MRIRSRNLAFGFVQGPGVPSIGWVQLLHRKLFASANACLLTRPDGTSLPFNTFRAALSAGYKSGDVNFQVRRALPFLELARSRLVGADGRISPILDTEGAVCVNALLAASFFHAQRLYASARTNLGSVLVQFLVDLDSSHTMIDRTVLHQFGRLPIGEISLTTPVSNIPVALLEQFDVSLLVPGPPKFAAEMIEAVPVLGGDFSAVSFKGILGKDIVAHLSWSRRLLKPKRETIKWADRRKGSDGALIRGF